jgi:predicted dehydrogenase
MRVIEDIPTTNVAVVGMGYWGPNIARNLQELPQAELAYICDSHQETLEVAARRFPHARVTADFAQILADPAVDAVAIATPVSTHHRLASAALEAGKHVFIEKPLASSSAEVLDLMASAERADRVLMPGHTFLYSPPVNLSRRLIQDGELGEIYFITMSRVNLGLHQTDISVVWDLAPHDFSILRYWLDEPPIGISAMSRSCVGTKPDVAFINLEYASGTIAHVELSWLAPTKLRRTAVAGSAKMLVYDDTSTEPVRIFDSGANISEPENFGEYRLTYRTGDIVSPPVPAAEPLSLELADFCRAIQTGAVPRSSADVGLDVVLMIEAVDHSLSLGGQQVPVRDVAASGRWSATYRP